MNEPSLPEKIVTIHRQLEQTKTPHAFGGALALAYYAEPRATIDIDINIFLAPSDYPVVERSLASVGVSDYADPQHVQRDGQCRLRWGYTPIDLFFAYDALHQAMREAVRNQPFGDARIPVLAPEHLVVCKAVFNRPKDWLDIEQVLVCVDDLDIQDVHRWLARILGEEDPKALRFRRMALHLNTEQTLG
jgi:hypothetical protein